MFRGPEGSGPKKFLIPWSENGSDYRLTVVEVKTIENLGRMEGTYAKVRYNQSSDKLAPEAQFVQRSDGVYIPRDTISMELLGVYAHMEKLGELEDRMGLTGLLPRPRLVSVETNVVNNGVREYDNASYFGDIDVIAIVPNTNHQTLPISLNGGILAHEHFHAIFYHTVLRQLKLNDLYFVHDNYGPEQKKVTQGVPEQGDVKTDVALESKYVNKIILSALNEGLADFWAWYYSNDPQFLEKSVRIKTLDRRRVIPNVSPLPSPQYFRRRPQTPPGAFAMGAAYELGTRYAGFMRALADMEGRKAASNALMSALDALSKNWEAISKNGPVSPNVWVGMLLNSSEKPSLIKCCLSRSFMSSDYPDYEENYRVCQNQGYTCPQR